MEPSVVVIGREPCETSKGPIAIGESVRLPIVEGIQLHHANKVTLADWRDQQVAVPEPSTIDRVMTAVESVVDAITVERPKRRRYRRRDLRSEQ